MNEEKGNIQNIDFLDISMQIKELHYMKVEPYFLPVYENFQDANIFSIMHLKLLI